MPRPCHAPRVILARPSQCDTQLPGARTTRKVAPLTRDPGQHFKGRRHAHAPHQAIHRPAPLGATAQAGAQVIPRSLREAVAIGIVGQTFVTPACRRAFTRDKFGLYASYAADVADLRVRVLRALAVAIAAVLVACAAPASVADADADAGAGAPTADASPTYFVTPSARPTVAPRILEWTSPTPIGPGVETASCAAVAAPETREHWLVGWHSTLTFAHHVNLWLAPAGVDIATWCKSHDTSALVFDASQPDLRVTAPDNGAIRVPAGVTFAVDVHELNTTDALATVRARIELELVDDQPGPELHAGTLMAQQFSVPAGTSETLSWACAVPAGASIAWMSSHTHRFTDLFTIKADGAEVFRTTTWAEPTQQTYSPAIRPSTLTWSSHIVNTTAATLSWGSSRDHNEMSNVWVYTFGAPFNCIQTKTVAP